MIETERVHQVRGLAGGRGEPAVRAAAGHGADEDPGLRGQVVHPYTVAEERTAGKRAAGIYRHDAYGLPAIYEKASDRRRERGLPGSRRTRNSGPPRPPHPFMELVQQVLEPRRLVLHPRDAAGQREGVAGSEALDQPQHGRRERTSGGVVHVRETASDEPALQEETATQKDPEWPPSRLLPPTRPGIGRPGGHFVRVITTYGVIAPARSPPEPASIRRSPVPPLAAVARSVT